eukprot:scaffold5037_cov114-Isochrysis_galbana.AAC.5
MKGWERGEMFKNQKKNHGWNAQPESGLTLRGRPRDYRDLSKSDASDCWAEPTFARSGRTGRMGCKYSMPADCMYAWQKRSRRDFAPCMGPTSCAA